MGKMTFPNPLPQVGRQKQHLVRLIAAKRGRHQTILNEEAPPNHTAILSKTKIFPSSVFYGAGS